MTDSFEPIHVNDNEGSFGKYANSRKPRDNNRAVAETVYARLRSAILSAELRPNKRLVEDELADWLKVSRTPIREALFLLEKEGLVERDRGWVVREHNSAEIRERLECRMAIEGYAARLAAARRSEDDLHELESLADVMEQPGISRLELNRLNDEFHKILIRAADNSSLLNLHSQTKVNYWNLNIPVIFGPEADKKDNEHHRILIEALAARDGDRAETVVRDHIQLTIDIVLASLGMKG